MGTQIQVLPTHDGDRAAVFGRPPVPRRARPVLVFAWLCLVAVPWVLQLRSFSVLVARHKITQNLIPPDDAVVVRSEADVTARCPATGIFVADVWYRIFPTHYYEIRNVVNASVLCHFVIPQYNTHGMYNIEKRKVKLLPSGPRSCTNDSYAANYYYYHGSVGYFALYAEGEGSYCCQDSTMHTVTIGVGSSDCNFNALAKHEGVPGYYSSYMFGCIGALWLTYRAIGLTRSCLSALHHGQRLDALGESISVSNAVVNAQQAARLAPHAATNWHRLALIYFLLEGLMTDLFLVSAFTGVSTKLQYISLGYNIAGLLSMLLEIIENSKLLKPSTLVLVKRLLFNAELALKGELLFSIAMSYYITAFNRSALGRTPETAQAVSYYAWGLFNHGLLVAGQTAFILTVRVVGTLVYVKWRFGSLRMLTMPCCVDSVMGYRCKIVRIGGYELHNQRLCFTQQTLKAHGLFKIEDTKGTEYLVYHKIHWLPSSREDLAVVGKLTGEHVDPWPESGYRGPVAVCDRILGGVKVEDRIRDDDDVDEMESAHLVYH